MARYGCVAVVVLLAATALAEEPVPLFTNADLERRFGPAPTPTTPATAPRPPAEQWEFVQRFLDREFARLDADRQLEATLARARADEARAYADAQRGRGYLMLAPYGYVGRGYRSDRFRARHGRGTGVRNGRDGYPTVRQRFFSPVTPIHARPPAGAVPRHGGFKAVPHQGSGGGGRR